MDNSVAEKILDIQEELAKQPDFAPLLAEYRHSNDRFLEEIRTMSPCQQDAVWDFLGSLVAVHMKTLEWILQK